MVSSTFGSSVNKYRKHAGGSLECRFGLRVSPHILLGLLIILASLNDKNTLSELRL